MIKCIIFTRNKNDREDFFIVRNFNLNNSQHNVDEEYIRFYTNVCLMNNLVYM